MANGLWRTPLLVVCALLMADKAAAGICVEVDVKFAGRTLLPATVQAMQDEAAAIWRPYGVQIKWSPSRHEVDCPSVQGSFDLLVEDQPSLTAGSSIVLGRTRMAPEGIDHVGICVDYDETQHQLQSIEGPQLFSLVGRPDIGLEDIGRALGRILAHEIGHVVLGASRHEPSGLMRRRFTPDELVVRHRRFYTLSKKEVDRLAARELEIREQSATGVRLPAADVHTCGAPTGR